MTDRRQVVDTDAQAITTRQSATEIGLLDTTAPLAERARLVMPEAAIYEGAPNALATGASRQSSRRSSHQSRH